MFGLLSKLAELLAQFGTGLVTLRRTAQDTDVAAALLRCAVALQDLCVRGERLLALAGDLVDGPQRPGAAQEFVGLVRVQAQAVDAVRDTLVECQELMATVDAEVYVRLAPFLDAKSGLLTRWQQQATMSALSSTTLFFLPRAALDEALSVGRAHSTPAGLAADRTDYLLAVGDGLRAARAQEVRDLSRAAATHHAPRRQGGAGRGQGGAGACRGPVPTARGRRAGGRGGGGDGAAAPAAGAEAARG